MKLGLGESLLELTSTYHSQDDKDVRSRCTISESEFDQSSPKWLA